VARASVKPYPHRVSNRNRYHERRRIFLTYPE
jgi:hypothetical protein